MPERDEALRAKYGQPRLLDHVDEVYAFGHTSREAAEAFAAANREDGTPAWIEERDGCWASVVDLRPAIAALPFRDGMTVTITPPPGVVDAPEQIRQALQEASRG